MEDCKIRQRIQGKSEDRFETLTPAVDASQIESPEVSIDLDEMEE